LRHYTVVAYYFANKMVRLIIFMGPIASCLTGRGLHSSTFQLNLSRFGHTSPCPPV